MKSASKNITLPPWSTAPHKFGDDGDLAINVRLHSACYTTRTWIYGGLVLAVDELRLASEDEGADLVGTAIDVREFVYASSTRTRPDLDSATAKQVYGELFDRHVTSKHALPWNRTAHVLSEAFDSSFRDTWTILAYRCANGSDRLVLKQQGSTKIGEVFVDANVLDRELLALADFVEKVLDAVGHPRESFPNRFR